MQALCAQPVGAHQSSSTPVCAFAAQVMVIQTAPSVRVSIGEELGLAPGRQALQVGILPAHPMLRCGAACVASCLVCVGEGLLLVPGRFVWSQFACRVGMLCRCLLTCT